MIRPPLLTDTRALDKPFLKKPIRDQGERDAEKTPVPYLVDWQGWPRTPRPGSSERVLPNGPSTKETPVPYLVDGWQRTPWPRVG
jgi:hypothetical protein